MSELYKSVFQMGLILRCSHANYIQNKCMIASTQVRQLTGSKTCDWKGLIFFKSFFFLKTYQIQYVKLQPKNEKFTQQRRQQQLLTCNAQSSKGYCWCFITCSVIKTFLKKQLIFSAQHLLYLTFLKLALRCLTCCLIIYLFLF